MKLKYLLFPVICLLLLCIMSCDSESGPEPESEPYLIVSAGASEIVERWFIVTNGNGEIIGYKKVGKSGEEFELTDRAAALGTYMNVLVVEIYDIDDSNNKYHGLLLYTGVAPGQRYTHAGDVQPPAKGSVRITVMGATSDFETRLSPGIEHPTTISEGSSTVLEAGLRGTTSEYVLSVYSPANPMYKIISVAPGQDMVYNYPNDFLPYNHIVEVETGKKNWQPADFLFGGTQGYRKDQLTLLSSFFISYYNPYSTVKYCYINNYDYYYTYYRFISSKGNREYHRIGTIPVNVEIVRPEPNMTVVNSSIASFQAEVSDDIDFRTSGYSYSEKIGEINYTYALSIASSINSNANVDLLFPEEFIAEVGKLTFEDSHYSGSSFYDFKSDKPYDHWINWNFNILGSPVEGEFFAYAERK